MTPQGGRFSRAPPFTKQRATSIVFSNSDILPPAPTTMCPGESTQTIVRYQKKKGVWSLFSGLAARNSKLYAGRSCIGNCAAAQGDKGGREGTVEINVTVHWNLISPSGNDAERQFSRATAGVDVVKPSHVSGRLSGVGDIRVLEQVRLGLICGNRRSGELARRHTNSVRDRGRA